MAPTSAILISALASFILAECLVRRLQWPRQRHRDALPALPDDHRSDLGRLFLGDGGAYFAGFAIAGLAVLLSMRNPEVSPWASFMVCAYPITEVMYSIVRRGRKFAGAPDRRHLHSLVATQVVQRRPPHLHPTLQNSAVSVIMWLFAAVPAIVAIFLYQSTSWLVAGAITCAAAYHFIYQQVARS
jgi:hypothetical protein